MSRRLIRGTAAFVVVDGMTDIYYTPRGFPVFLPVAIRFYHQLAQGVEVAAADIRPDCPRQRAATGTDPGGFRHFRGDDTYRAVRCTPWHPWRSRDLSVLLGGGSGVVRVIPRLVHLGPGDGAARLGVTAEADRRPRATGHFTTVSRETSALPPWTRRAKYTPAGVGGDRTDGQLTRPTVVRRDRRDHAAEALGSACGPRRRRRSSRPVRRRYRSRR